MGDAVPGSADEYIRERLLEGARDPGMLAKELTTPGLRGLSAEQQLALLRPLVRAYAQNRVGGWRRAIDNMAGRSAAAKAAAHPQWGPEKMSPVEARQARLSESMYVPGKGYIVNADATREDFEAAIKHLRSIIGGVERSIHFYEKCIAVMEKHGVQTFGEVPLDEPLE